MTRIQLLDSHNAPTPADALSLENTVDANQIDFGNHRCIVLNFPKFTDGRAYSQAVVLRRRGFQGDLRATGDVLLDQLLQMQRTGFSSAVLRADQNKAHAEKLLTQFAGFYQGSADHPQPHFA